MCSPWTPTSWGSPGSRAVDALSHILVLRAREIAGYEPVASLAVAAPSADPDRTVDGVRDALVEAVRTRLAAPRHVQASSLPTAAPFPRYARHYAGTG